MAKNWKVYLHEDTLSNSLKEETKLWTFHIPKQRGKQIFCIFPCLPHGKIVRIFSPQPLAFERGKKIPSNPIILTRCRQKIPRRGISVVWWCWEVQCEDKRQWRTSWCFNGTLNKGKALGSDDMLVEGSGEGRERTREEREWGGRRERGGIDEYEYVWKVESCWLSRCTQLSDNQVTQNLYSHTAFPTILCFIWVHLSTSFKSTPHQRIPS